MTFPPILNISGTTESTYILEKLIFKVFHWADNNEVETAVCLVI